MTTKLHFHNRKCWAIQMACMLVCALVLSFTTASAHNDRTVTRTNHESGLTIKGNLPVTATVEAVPVNVKAPNGKPAVAAYDITIKNGNREWQPAAGEPVMVSLTNKKFVDGKLLDVYHQGPNGPEFVATVAPKNGTITFPGYSFSVYIVSEAPEFTRLKVVFRNPNDPDPLATYYVKPDDATSDSLFKLIVWDPGAGTLLEGEKFLGWTDIENYTVSDAANAMTIAGVRQDLKDNKLAGTIADGTEVVYYAMLYKTFSVTYTDENGTIIAVNNLLAERDATSYSNYKVYQSYTAEEPNYNLVGWDVIAGAGNINATAPISNNTFVNLTGDVTLKAHLEDGRWLIFEEGEGGTYNAPIFVKWNTPTVCPVLAQPENMIRNGYTFGGWYNDDAFTTPFTFGDTIAANKTIYAKWDAKTTAGYAIIVWKQNLTADGYDYDTLITRTNGIVNDPIDNVVQVGTGNDAMISVDGTAITRPGFHLSRFDEGKTVSLDGSTVVNVYYDRTEYTLTFATMQYQATTSNTGTQYGSVGGQYVELTYRNNRWQYRGTFGWTNYNGTRYIRVPGTTVKTITALYEQDIHSNFPIQGTNGVNYTGYVWDPVNSAIFTSGQVPSLETMPAESTTFLALQYGTTTSVHMYYYTEAQEQTAGGGRVLYNGMYYDQHQHVTINASGGINSTKTEDFYDIMGYQQQTSVPAYDADGIAALNNTNNYTIRFYYTRKVYSINYMDGSYVDGDGNSMSSTDLNQLGTAENIPYLSDMSSYNEGGANYFDANTSSKAPEGFVFAGWFWDKSCTQPCEFTSMPDGGMTVYAKWHQIQYRVFLHPNAGTQETDPSLEWGTASQAMCFRVSYNSKVSAPTGKRDGWQFVGWFTDEGLNNAFNDETRLTDAITTTYIKRIHFTDPMDRWGTLGENPFNTDTAHAADPNRDRFWVTKRFDIYAKWRKNIDGAPGIKLVYQVGNSADERVDTNYYVDNTDAIALPATTHNNPTDSIFSYWEVQKWNASSNAFENSGVNVFGAGNFTVLLANAKKENITDTTFKYTIQLVAHYEAKPKATPTFIVWFKNDGSHETVRVDSVVNGHRLGINEAVKIVDAPEREGYIFKGWFKANLKDVVLDAATPDTAVCEPNFLDYDGTDYLSHTTGNVADSVAADEAKPYDYLYAVWQRDFTIEVPATVCTGYELPTTTTTPAGLPGTWTLNDAPVTTVTASGKYVFTLSDECGSDTIDITVDESALEVTLKDTTVCYGSDVTLTPTVIPAGTYNYAWSDGSTTSASLELTNVTENVEYMVTVTSAACSNTANVKVTVNKPTVDITGEEVVCFDSALVLTAAGTGMGTVTYAWDNGTTGATNTLTALQTNGEASVILTDSVGCKAYDTLRYTVYDQLIPGSIQYEKKICNQDTIAMVTGTTAASGGVNGHYQWESAEAETGPWSEVADGTEKDYTMTNIHHLYMRRAWITDCGTVYTNTVYIVNVGTVSVGSPTGKDTTYCEGTNVSHAMSVTGASASSGATLTYLWFTSTDNGATWTQVASTQDYVYTNSNFTEEVWFKYMILLDEACDTVKSNSVRKLKVAPSTSMALNPKEQTKYYGEDITTVEINAQNGTIVIDPADVPEGFHYYATTMNFGNSGTPAVGDYRIPVRVEGLCDTLKDTIIVHILPKMILNCPSTTAELTKQFDGTILNPKATADNPSATILYSRSENGTDWSSFAEWSATYPGITNVGKVYVKATAVLGEYKSDTCDYELEVTKARLIIKDLTSTKKYDGDTLTVNFDNPDVVVQGLVAGDAVTAGVLKTRGYVAGNYTYQVGVFGGSMFSGEAFIDTPFETFLGIDNYEVVYNIKLTITYRSITITADDAQQVYNGTPLTKDSYTVTGDGLASTDEMTVNVAGSQTCVGSSANVPSGAVIMHQPDNVEVNDSYEIVYVNGTLTVDPVTTGFECPNHLDIVLPFSACDTVLDFPSADDSAKVTPAIPNAIIDNDYDGSPLIPGSYVITWSLKDECGNIMLSCPQNVSITFPPCPDAKDFEDTIYHSVRIGCDCWTSRNLLSTKYSDGSDIPNVHSYVSADYPNAEENVKIFGHLYDWEAVVNGETPNANGHIQGICPKGWYVPTAEQYAALSAYGTDALRSPDYWLNGAGGSNTTGFTSLPGGYYDGSIDRYINLMAEAYYWSTKKEGSNINPSASVISFFCESVVDATVREGLGYSVRCIKER